MVLEELEVPANRLDGDAEILGGAGDSDATLRAGLREEVAPALVTLLFERHGHILARRARAVHPLIRPGVRPACETARAAAVVSERPEEAAFVVAAFATGCHWLRPLGSF